MKTMRIGIVGLSNANQVSLDCQVRSDCRDLSSKGVANSLLLAEFEPKWPLEIVNLVVRSHHDLQLLGQELGAFEAPTTNE